MIEMELITMASPRSFDWGGGVGFIGTQTHLPPTFSFFSDFSYFIFLKLENANLSYVSGKKILGS